MKKVIFVLALLSTSLFARPDDWSWLSQRSQHDRLPTYSNDPYVTEGQIMNEGIISLIALLKTKYTCKILDASEDMISFACFADDDVVNFCSIDLVSTEVECIGE